MHDFIIYKPCPTPRPSLRTLVSFSIPFFLPLSCPLTGSPLISMAVVLTPMAQVLKSPMLMPVTVNMSGRSCTSCSLMQISVLCGRLVLHAHDITSSLLSIYLLIGPSDTSKGIFGAEERIAGSQEGASCFQKVRQQSRWT